MTRVWGWLGGGRETLEDVAVGEGVDGQGVEAGRGEGG